MKKIAHIWVRDEVYMTVAGLEPGDHEFLHKKYSIKVDGHFFMPAYRLGRWNGCIAFYEKTGKVFMRFLGDILPFLEKWGYEIELHDERRPMKLVEGRLTENWFEGRSQVPFVLRPYQVQAVNLALDAGSGVVVAATGSGKTAMVAGMCDVLGADGLRTITIVPSADLVEQTSNTFKLLNIEHGLYSGASKDLYKPHVIGTWQAIQNNPHIMEDFQACIIDECFTGDQLVLTSTGYKRIDSVNIGDLVVSKNEDNSYGLNPVDHVFCNRNPSSKLLELTFDTGVVCVTEDHIFYTSAGLVAAKDLTAEHEIISHSSRSRDLISQTRMNDKLQNACQVLRVLCVIVDNTSGGKIQSAILSSGLILTGIEYKKMLALANSWKIYWFDCLFSSNRDKNAAYAHILKSALASANGSKSTGVKRAAPIAPWNKGIKTGQIPWNKNKTKNTDARLLAVSLTKRGNGNPRYGVSPSIETRQKLSNSTRRAILEGRFTPDSSNYWTKNRGSSYAGTKFRSSWEALFWSMHQHLLFEPKNYRFTLDDGTIFIPDFVDVDGKVIYEIKPFNKFQGSKSERGLQQAAKCGWSAKLICQFELVKLYPLIDRGSFDPDTLRRIDASFKNFKCT